MQIVKLALASMHFYKMKKHHFLNLIYLAIIPSSILYICILLFTSAAGIETGLVLRDLLQTCDYPIGVGMISSIGVILWASASSINFFALNDNLMKNRRYKKLLIIGGIFSTVLCLDDLFLLHDKQQINQDILYTIYISLALYLILKFRELITEIDIFAFITSSSFLALSIVSDIFQDFLPINYENVQILEEGFKFIGISCWVYFWSKAAIQSITTKNIRKRT